MASNHHISSSPSAPYTPEWEEELLSGAESIIKQTPGITFDSWCQQLFTLYPTEVVDTFGPNEDIVHSELSKLWCSLIS